MESISNEWTDDIEREVKRIANKNGAMQWLHNKTVEAYTLGNKIWSIVTGILIAACGGSGIPTIIIGIPAASIVFQSITIVAGLVIIIQAIVALNDLASTHQDAATRNSEQFLIILKELSEPNYNLRIRGTRFLHMVLEREASIKNKEVHIPSRIIRKYYLQFGAKSIPYNELFGSEDILYINDNMLKARSHEVSLVNNLRQTKSAIPASPEPLLEDNLEELLEKHDRQEPKRYRRHAPPPGADELRIIENYLRA